MPSRHASFKKHNLTDAQNSYYIARKRMVEEQIILKVKDPRVISAVSKVPRHKFVFEEALISQAYNDHPLNIGEGQTISQPLMVAIMTESLRLKGQEKILEIGTGSGYQTAILCELSKHVYSIERISKLSNRARRVLYDLGYTNFSLRIGDGTLGWKEASPFNGIIVTAGSPSVPQPFLDQLADGGRLVIPVGDETSQVLKIFTKNGDKISETTVSDCRFVKLIGEHGWKI